MRKSTVIAIAIIVFAAISMLLLADSYTGQFKADIQSAKELTDEFRDSIAKDTKIKLLRTGGSAKYVVEDREKYGLIVEVSPSAETLKRDPTVFVLSREIALRAFDIYAIDRPIRWVEFRVFRTDGTRLPPIALERGEGSSVVPVESGEK